MAMYTDSYQCPNMDFQICAHNLREITLLCELKKTIFCFNLWKIVENKVRVDVRVDMLVPLAGNDSQIVLREMGIIVHWDVRNMPSQDTLPWP